MPGEDHEGLPATGNPSRRYHLLTPLLALVIVAVVAVLFLREDDPPVAPGSPTPPSEATLVPHTTTPDVEAEVVTRLREILQTRERAFRVRDASLFESIYSSDCPCLRAGRDAIAALKKENILWRDRSISILVKSASSLNERLWEVDALFLSDPFRIETEEGRLVREAPAERLRYRFLLVRASEADPWLLGNASLVEGS
jgi:hypothetical protein